MRQHVVSLGCLRLKEALKLTQENRSLGKDSAGPEDVQKCQELGQHETLLFCLCCLCVPFGSLC